MLAKDYRKVSSTGCVGIPAQMRRELGIEKGDPMELEPNADGSIKVTPYKPRCIFCGSTAEVWRYNGKTLCASCVREIMTDKQRNNVRDLGRQRK